MQIYGPYRVSTAAAGNVGSSSSASNAGGVNRTADLTGAKPSATPVDQLDLSSSTSSANSAGSINRLDAAGPSQEIAGGGEIRVDKVADLRRQIASGNYDTPEKLDVALDRLLDVFG